MNKYFLGFLMVILLVGTVSATAEYCYQEDATVSTSCGGLGTGSYTASGNWIGTLPVERFYDDDWTTQTYAIDGTSYVSVNYQRPYFGTSGSLLEVKHGNQRYNITIPNECLNDIVKLRMMSKSTNSGSERASQPSCFDGEEWIDIGNLIEGDNNEQAQIFEEAIWWAGRENVDLEVYDEVELPQVTSFVPLDDEGSEKISLYCTWRIGNEGETLVKMTGNKCPEEPQTFVFDDDETYVVSIEAFKSKYEKSLDDWQFVDGIYPKTSGFLEVHYDVEDIPEPSQDFWDNVLDFLRSRISWICEIFPGLGIC